MTNRHRFSTFGAVLAVGLAAGMLDGAARADSKVAVPQQPSAGPAATTQLKARQPGPVKDIYCTHDSNNTNFPACGDAFAAKCKEIGGTLNDPTGNPDYGACIHDDHW